MSRPKPVPSFWLSIILLVGPIGDLARSIATSSSDSLAAVIAFPFQIILAAVLIAFSVGLYRRNKRTLKLYLIYIPFGILSLMSLVLGGNRLPTSGYGVASSLQLMGYVAALIFSVGVLEYQAIKDLRRLKRFNG